MGQDRPYGSSLASSRLHLVPLMSKRRSCEINRAGESAVWSAALSSYYILLCRSIHTSPRSIRGRIGGESQMVITTSGYGYRCAYPSHLFVMLFFIIIIIIVIVIIIILCWNG